MRITEAKTAPRMSEEQAEYERSWEEQIRALTEPGLTDEERVKAFCLASGADYEDLMFFVRSLGGSPARACWRTPFDPMSLFADLPGCSCPVIERLEGVPHRIPKDWRPTADELRVFAHHQRVRRFP